MYPGSLRVSEYVKDLLDPAIKEKMISANDSMVMEELNRLNDFLKKNGKPAVDKTQYMDAVISGDASKLGIDGLKFGKAPKFLETRAMVNGNICNNLTFMV